MIYFSDYLIFTFSTDGISISLIFIQALRKRCLDEMKIIQDK